MMGPAVFHRDGLPEKPARSPAYAEETCVSLEPDEKDDYFRGLVVGSIAATMSAVLFLLVFFVVTNVLAT